MGREVAIMNYWKTLPLVSQELNQYVYYSGNDQNARADGRPSGDNRTSQ